MKKAILGALFAGAMLASCSSDEPLVNGGEDNNNGEDRYLTVNICAPQGAGSRTATANDFEDGTLEESNATSGLFLFFDDGGNMTQVPQTVALSWQANSGNSLNPAITKISETTVVVAGKTSPTKVLVVLNAPSSVTSNIANKTFTEVRDLIGAYSQTTQGEGESKVGVFVMTNSVYKDGTTEICATDISNNVKRTREEAMNNAADIFVERVLAKVSATWTSNFSTTNTTLDGLNGTDTELTLVPVITGIEVANISNDAYLFKSIKDIDYTWANDADNKRFYWETVPTGLTYSNKSYSQISVESFTKSAFTEYILPNTNQGQKTAILVTAELHKGSATGDAANLVYHNGIYYEADEYLKQYAQVAANGGFFIKETVDDKDVYTSIPVSNFNWMSDEDRRKNLKTSTNTTGFEGWETTAVFTPTDGTDYYTYKKGEDGSISKDKDGNPEFVKLTEAKKTIDEFLLNEANRVWYWKDGKCYYFVNIDQTPVAKSQGYQTEDKKDAKDHTFDGVIRNHVYKLELASLKGLGTPVYDPTEIIIPQKPSDDLFYLAANINILKWRIVNQTVNFE